jgi:hypothetical protein
MEDEPILESATMVAMDICELFQIVDGDIVYDVNKAIDLILRMGICALERRGDRDGRR